MDTTNEPVAWIPKGMTLAKPKDLTDCIPLYTHPTKTLTDEKIVEIYNDILIHDKKSSIKFARAILKKAREK
jgi:hypothetical protein